MAGAISSDPQALFDEAHMAQQRYQRACNMDDLTNSIQLARTLYNMLTETMSAHPRSNRLLQGTRILLARSLGAQYACLGAEDDLSEQICLAQDAVNSLPLSDPGRAAALRLLGTAFRISHDRTGIIAELEQAVSVHRETLEATKSAGSSDHWESLGELGRSLMRLYQRQGDKSNLSEAISFQQEALFLCPEDDLGRSSALHGLANTTWVKYNNGGTLHELEESIMYHLKALDLHPQGHWGRHSSLNDLGAAFQSRYQQSSNINDLNASIAHYHEALSNRVPGHPDRIMLLSNLSSVLMLRFTHFGHTNDLDQSLSLAREAHELCPEGHSN